MRQADLLSPWAAVGTEPGGGRSAHLGGMPSFWCPSLFQMPSPSLGLDTSFMGSEWQPAGTCSSQALPDQSFSQERWAWHYPGYLPTRTAYWDEDATLSMTRHLVPSGHVCKFPRLTSAGMSGSSLWGDMVAEGYFGARRTRYPLRPGGSGMEQLGQSCSKSWQ